jgi:hypothetical protein
MRRFRFRIGTLLIVIIVLGVGFAALRESNDMWDSGVFTLALCALLVSILLAIHRNGSRRAFWVGFALFGAAYLGLSLVPPIESRLITKKALAYLDSKLLGRSLGFFTIHFTGTGSGGPGDRVQTVAFTVDGKRLATSSPGQVRLWDTTVNFVRIGHSLFALLAGGIGGLLSRRLWRASRATDGSTPVRDDGTNP